MNFLNIQSNLHGIVSPYTFFEEKNSTSNDFFFCLSIGEIILRSVCKAKLYHLSHKIGLYYKNIIVWCQKYLFNPCKREFEDKK
ncbi:hypothetical protein LEP1GSC165_3455 [Leptospira santarosai str. CBC523]|nr:hypothetical protein LEP1GSC165_3455 [Leptospira santarosai str. CBC523]